MDYRRLGKSGLIVSAVGLGTMNFGSQVDQATSHRILDRAVEAGVTFIDTAGSYASPPSPETSGKSEDFIGSWLKGKPRDRVVIATKISGPVDGMFSVTKHLRGGTAVVDPHHIVRAVETSLKRLGTDYIDLYQTHWPERVVPVEVQLEAFQRLIAAGKIRYIGTSNETPWGLTRLVTTAENRSLPRPVSVQNLFNLIQRGFERGLAEVCREESVGFIAYSPLAMGLLSGKYAEGKLPQGSRLQSFERYRKSHGQAGMIESANAYVALAREAGLDPAVMALAWVRSHRDVTSVLSSCSSMAQVETMLAGADLTLGPDLLARVEELRDEFEPPWSRLG